ncbi:uncharacterized protein LOC111358402 [Spodoptera litura]|uniref:Uncharacterized protein LOC111358402 n=1 Tax=Spodoptera litura TaxID=69820 RepID=A0A9J7IXK8_SPOLT|nr:uncharacterized protein LOC111358402 [Spodoptera litura]
MLQVHRMRAVILVMAVASAVAELAHVSTDIAVPTVLEGAAPEDVLLYLYDVLLTSFMLNEPDKEGTIGPGIKCPGNVLRRPPGICPSETIIYTTTDYSIVYND